MAKLPRASSSGRLYDVVMLVYLVSGILILPTALLLLACRFELIQSEDLCFSAHLGPLMALAAFTGIGWIPAIGVVIVYRDLWLVVLPAVLLALIGLSLWLPSIWVGLIPSALVDPILYVGAAIYAITATSTGLIWLVRKVTKNS